MSDEAPKDLLGKIAYRGRDILVVIALLTVIGSTLTVVSVLVSDSKAASSFFGKLVGVPELTQQVNDLSKGVDQIPVIVESVNKLVTSVQVLNTQVDNQADSIRIDREASLAATQRASDERNRIFDLIQDAGQERKDLFRIAGEAAEAQRKMTEKLVAIQQQIKSASDDSPAIKFASGGHTISDGPIGGTVSIQYYYYQLRDDCGRSHPEDLFLDVGGRLFHFEDVSVLDNAGRGQFDQADPQLLRSLKYTAKIPDDRGVDPGAAQGWVMIHDYENCPQLDPVLSPKITFTILPKGEKVFKRN